jgi:hypothetical protein
MNGDQDSGAAVLSRRMALGKMGLTVAAAGAVAPWPRIATAQEATPADPPDFKVVLHVSQDAHWPYAISNLRNLEQEQP